MKNKIIKYGIVFIIVLLFTAVMISTNEIFNKKANNKGSDIIISSNNKRSPDRPDPVTEHIPDKTEYYTRKTNTEKAEVTNEYESMHTAIETTAVKAEVLCDELSEFLECTEYDYSDIEDSEQVIAVQSDGWSCDVRLFEKNNSIWEKSYDAEGIVGYNGVSEKSRENVPCTPRGIFDLGFAFGTEDVEGLMVDYKKITENSYWVDDPESEYYNQWAETDNITWNSAEHLIEYPQSYKYAIEIRYNQDPIIPYKGSAIFLHCAVGSYTAGCVAVPESDMLFILEWINKNKKPVIVIN